MHMAFGSRFAPHWTVTYKLRQWNFAQVSRIFLRADPDVPDWPAHGSIINVESFYFFVNHVILESHVRDSLWCAPKNMLIDSQDLAKSSLSQNYCAVVLLRFKTQSWKLAITALFDCMYKCLIDLLVKKWRTDALDSRLRKACNCYSFRGICGNGFTSIRLCISDCCLTGNPSFGRRNIRLDVNANQFTRKLALCFVERENRTARPACDLKFITRFDWDGSFT